MKTSPIKVLLVEDDQFDVIAFMRALEDVDLEIDVKVCYSGEDTLTLLDGVEWVPDLVLVDERLPGMSGNQLEAILNQVHPEIRIIRLTGHPLEVAEEDTICLMKPASSSMLEMVFRSTLALQKVAILSKNLAMTA